MSLWQVDGVVVPGVASPEPVSFAVADAERFAVIYDAEAGLGAVLAGLVKPVSGTFSGPSVVLASPDIPLPPRETKYIPCSLHIEVKTHAITVYSH